MARDIKKIFPQIILRKVEALEPAQRSLLLTGQGKADAAVMSVRKLIEARRRQQLIGVRAEAKAQERSWRITKTKGSPFHSMHGQAVIVAQKLRLKDPEFRTWLRAEGISDFAALPLAEKLAVVARTTGMPGACRFHWGTDVALVPDNPALATFFQAATQPLCMRPVWAARSWHLTDDAVSRSLLKHYKTVVLPTLEDAVLKPAAVALAAQLPGLEADVIQAALATLDLGGIMTAVDSRVA